MDLKQIKKKIKRAIGFYSLRIFGTILSLLPKRWIYAISEFIAGIGYFFALRHRHIAYESLNIAFGNSKTKKEIKKIIKDCFANMIKGMLEMFVSLDNPKNLDKIVNIEGKEHLDKALAKGKGVIMVSGHFGNFPLLLTKLAILGYKVNTLIRKMRDERADEYFYRKREALGVKSIYTSPNTECVRNSIEALRNNEVVFILMDQNFGRAGGVFVDFFGRKAATAPGAVVFALRTHAPIVPAFIFRNQDNTHQLIIEPELDLELGKNKDETVRINVAKITKIIERYIRKYPAEWGWIHRRWKSQPRSN
jgi:KDO2-lipid IV(A) lauroyltransferase